MRRTWWIVVVFAVWTVLIWATRIDNIWSDPELDSLGRLSRTALAGSFVVLGGLTLAQAWRDRRLAPRPGAVYLVAALAAWTVAIWIVRGTGIVLDDHDTAFKIVHTVLGGVSITLALAAFMAVRSSVSDPSLPSRRDPSFSER